MFQKPKHPKLIGELTESIIISKLLSMGCSVAQPIGDNLPFDLLVLLNNKWLRIQCKTGKLKKDGVLFNTSKCRINTKKSYRTNYIGLCDIFIVYCYENNNFYLINIQDIPNGNCLLRINKTKNNQKKSIRMANDFSIETGVAKLV